MDAQMIGIDGEQQAERHLVYVKRPGWQKMGRLWLPLCPFRYLTILALGRLAGDGWVPAEEIDTGEYQARYMYRLRRLSQLQIDNDKRGSYRLADGIQVFFNNERLRGFADYRISSQFMRPRGQSIEEMKGVDDE